MEKKGKKHIFVDIVHKPTCRESGYTLHSCKCGYEYKSSFVPAAHKFKVKTEEKPTCTEKGSQHLVCEVCRLEKNNVIEPTGHIWGAWNTYIVPSCLEAGMMARACRKCSETQDLPIPATGHKLTRPRQSATKEYVTEYFCVNCGEIVEVESVGIEIFLKKHKKWLLASGIAMLLVIAAVILLCWYF